MPNGMISVSERGIRGGRDSITKDPGDRDQGRGLARRICALSSVHHTWASCPTGRQQPQAVEPDLGVRLVGHQKVANQERLSIAIMVIMYAPCDPKYET